MTAMPSREPCPVRRDGATVTFPHGGGGKAMKDLIDVVFVAAFKNLAVRPLED